jgi:HEAT repeat protein
MANLKIEEQLEQLDLLGRASAIEAIKGLRKGLADRVNVVVAKAARIASTRRMTELVPDLLKTFDTLLITPDRDPQCWGKNEIVKTLVDLDYSDSSPFLRGLKHVQMEPIWGRRVDTAGTLRGRCLLALVQATDLPRADKLREFVAALTDAEHEVRTDAIRALEQLAGNDCELLLRLKASVGDEESQVTGQAIESVLKLGGEPALPFAASFLLSARDDVRQEAALALGASHLSGSLDILKKATEKAREESFRRAILTAIGTSREEGAMEFLFDQLESAMMPDAEGALEALALHRQSIAVVEKVAKLVQNRRSKRLEEQFEVLFERRRAE